MGSVSRLRSSSYGGQVPTYAAKAASLSAQEQRNTAPAAKQPAGQITKILSSRLSKNIPLNMSGKSVL